MRHKKIKSSTEYITADILPCVKIIQGSRLNHKKLEIKKKKDYLK